MGATIKMDNFVKETQNIMPMLECCSFAYVILNGARRFVKHSIADRVEIDSKLLTDKLLTEAHSHFNKAENLHGYSPADLGYWYLPEIEGGYHYNSYLKTISEEKKCGFDVFKYSVGMALKNYYCYFVRTSVLHCTRQIQDHYSFLILVHHKVLECLKDGIELCKVYKAVQLFAKQTNPKLAEHLKENFGFELNPNLEMKSLFINSRSQGIAKKDSFFAISTDLIGLQENGIQYNLCHSDTVLVREGKEARVLTNSRQMLHLCDQPT